MPVGVDPGWDYHPGKADQGARLARALLERTIDLPPQLGATVLPFRARLLPDLARDYRTWLDTIDRARPRGERRIVGLLTEPVLQGLAARGVAPQNAAITVSDRALAHMLRDAKAARGSALPEDAIRGLPEALASPRAVLWDKRDPALVYVFDAPVDPRSGKFVLRVDFAEKARDRDGLRRPSVTNAVRSGGMVDPVSLTRPQEYDILEGAM